MQQYGTQIRGDPFCPLPRADTGNSACSMGPWVLTLIRWKAHSTSQVHLRFVTPAMGRELMNPACRLEVLAACRTERTNDFDLVWPLLGACLLPPEGNGSHSQGKLMELEQKHPES